MNYYRDLSLNYICINTPITWPAGMMGHTRRVLLAVYSAHVQWLDWQWFPLAIPVMVAGNIVSLFYINQVACNYCTVMFGKSCTKIPTHMYVLNSIMMLVKFLTSANQKHRSWSCDESGLCNPRPRLLGDEVLVGPSLMFRKMYPWNIIRNILQDKTDKNQLQREMVFCW